LRVQVNISLTKLERYKLKIFSLEDDNKQLVVVYVVLVDVELEKTTDKIGI